MVSSVLRGGFSQYVILNDPIHWETFSSHEHMGESLVRQEAEEMAMIEVI